MVVDEDAGQRQCPDIAPKATNTSRCRLASAITVRTGAQPSQKSAVAQTGAYGGVHRASTLPGASLASRSSVRAVGHCALQHYGQRQCGQFHRRVAGATAAEAGRQVMAAAGPHPCRRASSARQTRTMSR